MDLTMYCQTKSQSIKSEQYKDVQHNLWVPMIQTKSYKVGLLLVLSSFKNSKPSTVCQFQAYKEPLEKDRRYCIKF